MKQQQIKILYTYDIGIDLHVCVCAVVCAVRGTFK